MVMNSEYPFMNGVSHEHGLGEILRAARVNTEKDFWLTLGWPIR